MVRCVKKIEREGWSKYQIFVSGHSWTSIGQKPKLTDLISTVMENEEKTSLQNAGGAKKTNLSAIKKVMSVAFNTKDLDPNKTHQPISVAVSLPHQSKPYVIELLNIFELDSCICGVRALSFLSSNVNSCGDASKKQFTNQCYNIKKGMASRMKSFVENQHYRKKHHISSHCGSFVRIFLIVFGFILAIYKAL